MSGVVNYTDAGAEISPCSNYRYRLWRAWGEGTRCVWIMLNPSTADGSEDDSTIRKCVGFAKRWGHDGIEVVNLFAYRSRSPDSLSMQEDPIGPRNNSSIMQAARSWNTIVCAWGNHGALNRRNGEVFALLRSERHALLALSINKTGPKQPRHPLYEPYETKLELWEPWNH